MPYITTALEPATCSFQIKHFLSEKIIVWRYYSLAVHDYFPSL